MHKLLPLGLASLFLVVTGCQDTNTTGPLAEPSFHEVGVERFFFAMRDDFATATEKGGSGSGQADVDGGTVEVEVEAEGLVPGVDYELHVTINFGRVETFTATADEDGEVEFEGEFELAPGTYRLDFFVTLDHPTILEADFPVPDVLFVFLLLDRDLLLRCMPAILDLVIS